MRIDVLGEVGAVHADRSVTGQALGGRRVRVALVALALADGAVPAERLASIIWGDSLPPTWQPALRGVIRSIRTACAPLGIGDQDVVATVPSGYRLGAGVEVDITVATDALRRAGDLLAEGRHQAALDLAEPVTRMTRAGLLPGEDAEWLAPHRRTVDALGRRALELVTAAAGGLGDHDRAVAAARQAVAADPLDERAHCALIGALDRSGDRGGAVQAFEDCRAALAEQLGVDPSRDTVDAYLAVLREPAVASGARLPAVASTFVGRAAEVAALGDALAEPGLVTVNGRGGVGKSRLALQVAATRGDFPGGRLWVSLASVGQDALLAATVALEVGVTVGTDDAAAALADHLAPLGRVLLILDGGEAVVDGAASLAAELVAVCPQLVVMVTSQVPLAIEGERVVSVHPLAEPDAGDDDLRANPQVRLLLDRVRAGGGELTLDDRVTPHVRSLVQRCGGLPLAVELVAAQLAAIPVGDLLDHLADVVVGGDDRLRAIARSSYALLDADEATVFRYFAVLDGWVGLPLVRHLVGGTPIPSVRVVRILRELTARGLLSVDRAGPRWRYQQDDDLHRFARELLIEEGAEPAAYARLADAVRAVLPDNPQKAPAPFRAEITDILGCVRSLFGAAVDGRADIGRGLELAFRLHRYFAATNVTEGRFWLTRLLAAEPDSEWVPYARYALGYLSYWSGDAREAVDQLESVVKLLAGKKDPYAARSLIYLAGLFDDLDRGTEAVDCVRRAITAAEPFDIDLQVAAAMGMGSVLAERGDPAAAAHAGDAIELCRQGGSPDQLVIALPTAAMVCWQVGAFAQARAYVDEAWPRHTESRRIARVVLLSTMSGLALTDDDLDAAIDHGRQADREATELGVEREAPLIRAVLARALLARGDLRGAADRALGALDAASAMAFDYPFAICFETAALVAAACGAGDPTGLAGLLASADVLRASGDRPAPPTLAGPLTALAAAVGDGAVLPVDDAIAYARAVLTSVTA